LDGRLDEPRGGREKKSFPARFQLLPLLCSTLHFKIRNSNSQNFVVPCCWVHLAKYLCQSVDKTWNCIRDHGHYFIIYAMILMYYVYTSSFHVAPRQPNIRNLIFQDEKRLFIVSW
jgi:hypothetical protein